MSNDNAIQPNTTTVFQLVYVSSAQKDIGPQDIQNILDTARTFNPKNNITGMLLYRGGIFLQLLEGEKAVVEKLYENIKKDSRHANLICLIEVNTNPRVYTEWSMAYREIDDLDFKMINQILAWNKLISAAQSKDNHLILHIFNRFKEKIAS